MALFSGRRDISLFRSINRELIKRIIQSEVDLIKVSIEDTVSNLYGESRNKVYYQDVRLACLIRLDEQDTKNEGSGPNITQTARFAFLRDDLKKAGYYPENGDLVDWNGALWEIDKLIEADNFMSKNPDYNKTVNEYDFNDILVHKFGWNVSIICDAHMTRKTRTSLDDMYSGDPDNINLK